MIRYTLNCAKRHRFEGWFRNSDAYERQSKRGEIRCPECGTTKVKKAIMAPALAGRASAPDPAQPSAVTAAPAPSAAEPASSPSAAPSAAPAVAAPAPPPMHVSGKMHEALREMRRFIEKNATYV